MSYSPKQIEVTRFFGRKGGVGIGCCAIDLIQGFVNDPDAKASVGLKHGDAGTNILKPGTNEQAFLGKTNREVFEGYLRVGTFDSRDMPNRIFLCSLTEDQCKGETEKRWLAILKENGFEFVRATDNSVYSGAAVNADGSQSSKGRPVYLFGLFRNIGATRLDDPFAPPAAWLELPEPSETHLSRWLAGETKFYTAAELAEPEPAPPSTTPAASNPA